MSSAKDSPQRRLMTDVHAHMTPEAQNLLEQYAEIPHDQVDHRVLSVRDKAWAITPYPALGMFRFLTFPLIVSPNYEAIRETLSKPGALLLDIGCGLGQDLRKLVLDGVPSEALVGVDNQAGFIDLGYELFQDKEKFKGKFVVADIFADDDDKLKQFKGKADYIYLGYFLHLFDRATQLRACEIAQSFLKPDGPGEIYGIQPGSEEPGERERLTKPGKSMYRHNADSMRVLWDDVGEKTGTAWTVEMKMEKLEDKAEVPPGRDEDAFRLWFHATRK